MLRRSGGIAAAAMVLSLAAGEQAGAAGAPGGPQLAFGALWSLNPKGMRLHTVAIPGKGVSTLLRGGRHRVTPTPFWPPSWTVDGALLAFSGSQGRRSGIYVLRTADGDLRFVKGSKDGLAPVFSPNGDRIAFSRTRSTTTRKGKRKREFVGGTTWIVAAAGGPARRLTKWRNGIDSVPASFSPDGTGLAITERELGSSEARALLLSPDGGRARVLARQSSEPVFSPDGSWIALIGERTIDAGPLTLLKKDLYVMSADGTAIRRLTRTPRWLESKPSWDPSGQRIAFNSVRFARDPFDAIFNELLPFGNSIEQVNTDGSCANAVLASPAVAIHGASWRPGPGREAGRIAC